MVLAGPACPPSCGRPAGLVATAVAWLAREGGWAGEWIGWLGLAAAPWALKFLWAPWVDRLGRGRPGHRKRWVIGCQVLVVLILLVLGVAIVGFLFINQMSSAEVTKDNAIAGAANEVGQAANQVGEAAQNTGEAVEEAVTN